ncbi:o-succinylbenzoate--CoA ligase [Mycobacterium sp. MYCO198283]|uniref:o-succinylbenzoate--CoA ligase n=1 Tax=Mycobacterium sp. MYCO198283 TaxID=2883505 RepID=UPI0027E15D5A|nr:o-succinylbenzoate--CoA ligase [Mycobacterium sp. MYCO198283]
MLEVLPVEPDAAGLVAAVADVLDGRIRVLPVPADDHRRAADLATALRAGEPVDPRVAVVIPTSGTTGTPKGAMLTVDALIASATATHDRLGGPGRWLLALPGHHIAGWQVVVRSVVAGTEPVVMAVDRGFDVAALPDAVAALGTGRRYASLVANQLAKALGHPPAARALAALDAVLLGGGPLPTPLAEAAVAQGIPVVRTYGMSETAGGCVYDGLPLDGVRMRIDDGRVVLGGATVALGYRNPPADDPFAEPGWFRTDDAGSIDAAGVLTVHGRIDEAVCTGGLTVLPQVVEAALADHPAVAECAVFGLPDERLGERVAVAVVPRGEPPTLDALRDHVSVTLDRTAAPRALYLVDALPRKSIGKVDRRALRDRFTPAWSPRRGLL